MRNAQIIADTKYWVDKFVIGLNLCPFARRPFVQDRIRYVVETSDSEEILSESLISEALYLTEVSPQLIETTLLIHPFILVDFSDYNDYLGKADWLLQQSGLEGVIQIASFHPDYQFAGTRHSDVENYTNRAPYPMLHLLREASIEEALEQYEHPEEIPARNIETMKRLGKKGIEALQKK